MKPSPLDFQPPDSLIEKAKQMDIASKEKGLIFHGTGRLGIEYLDRDKSKPTGQTIDVLENILKDGLIPNQDHLSRLFLPKVKTISLTRDRLYARTYGEEFGQNEEGSNYLHYKFGDTKALQKYYYGASLTTAKSDLRNAIWIPKMILNYLTRFDQDERKKIRDVEFHKSRWYSNKILSRDNYPVVLGIKESAIKPINLPNGWSLFEIRHGEIITPDQIAIIETPEANIEQTRKLISKLGLAIQTLPMELCEVTSQQLALAEISNKY